MRVAILGSGFGLYCYLPAILVGCGQSVLLPDRYRDRLRLRTDVGYLSDRVEWAGSEETMLELADALVICQRPADQVERARDCLQRDNISRLLLEKPLAPDPTSAASLLSEIENSRKPFRIGYLFRYTEWGKELLRRGRDASEVIHIDWRFRAHHYTVGARNWKRLVSTGGGAIRFYGIHLIALLAEVGYRHVLYSYVGTEAFDEARAWHAVITGNGLPHCQIDVDTNDDRRLFSVYSEHASSSQILDFALSGPFETPEKGRFDDRVAMLTELCRDLFQDGGTPSPNYENSIRLWRDIERKTTVGPVDAVWTR